MAFLGRHTGMTEGLSKRYSILVTIILYIHSAQRPPF